MKTNYPAAMKQILIFEGGNDNDPRDPGGRTSQGITQRVYSAWRLKNGKPNGDVFDITPADRDAIYYQNYGSKVRFDELPPGVDLVLFDGAVNSGVSQSVKWIQRALGIRADGVLGETTMQRILDAPDHDRLCAAYIGRRDAFLRGLKTFKTFGKGWTRRTAQVLKLAQLWAMGSVGPDVVFVANGNKKADLQDRIGLLSTAPADFTTAGGGMSTALTTIQGVLEPLQANPFVNQVLMGVLVAGVVATAGGLAYRAYVNKQRANLTDVLDLVPDAAPADNDNVPQEVLREYDDPKARGTETGNIAMGVTTTSGRQYGDTETRVA